MTPADEEGPAIPIGRPIANSRVHVLDRTGQPTPVGVPGELHIGGFGIARGYLSHPELSAERFVPDPFGSESGGRLYRTGDRARYRADGTLELLGRIDHQVKVRGHRVELGEIETVLGEHRAVREAAVVACEQPSPGDHRLAAYVVRAAAELPPLVGELRSFLQRRLPGYMIPAEFIWLAQLPRTPNGKVDRRRLPVAAPAERPVTFAAPRTAIEAELAELWSRLLGVGRIGIDESFFDAGGHSLLAARLLSRVRTQFRVDLPLRAFFEDPTVAGQALAVTGALAEGAGSGEMKRMLDLLDASPDGPEPPDHGAREGSPPTRSPSPRPLL